MLVVVPLVKVGFDDVDSEDAEEVDERCGGIYILVSACMFIKSCM